jgi:hypothetical protein
MRADIVEATDSLERACARAAATVIAAGSLTRLAK